MSNNNMDIDKELEAVLGAHKTRIKIIGTGGGGNNTVTRLLEVGIKGVEVVAVNTDAQDLLYARADRKILIGKTITNGLGAGSDPAKGEESAKESIEDIQNALADTDMVFITCGLGGGTGTGSAPVIAEAAKKAGALTIAIVTLPFSDEGIVRWENANAGLELLERNVDTVIVVQNDRLLDLVPDMPLTAAFKVADEILVNAVKGITELVTQKGLVNLDFADVRTIMQNGGLAMIGLGEDENETNVQEAAEKALQNPLLDVDITGAKSALINITGGQELSLKAAKTIMKIIAERLDPAARIIWGARLDESMGQSIRVMLIVTSLRSKKKSRAEVERAIKKSPAPAKPTHEKVVRVQAEDLDAPPKAIQENGAKKAKEKGSGTKLFSDIFVEESEADIDLIQAAVIDLRVGRIADNEDALQRIRRSSSSIYSSAELFSYKKIAEIAEVVSDLAECAINGEFELSESFIDLFRQVPSTFREMMDDDASGYEVAEELMQKFRNILNLLDEGDKDGHDGRTEEKSEQSGKAKEKGKAVGDALNHFDKFF
jgi:cell division protein FtsZ